MPCAKGHRRLDQKWLGAVGHGVCVMAAVDIEPPRLDRRQLTAHLGDPVLVRHFGNHERLRIMCSREKFESRNIRRRTEIGAHLPGAGAVLDLEGSDPGGFGVQHFKGLGERLGPGLAGERGQGGVGCHLGSIGIIRRLWARGARTGFRSPARGGAGSGRPAEVTRRPCPPQARKRPQARSATNSPEGPAERPRRYG